MTQLLTAYPYLWLSSALLLTAVLAIAFGRQRGALLAAGGIGMLFGLFSFEFIPWYWDPQVIGHFVTSPEDLMFSFATGTLAWWLAAWLLNGRLRLDLQLRGLTFRAVGYALPGIAIAYAFGLTVMNHMPLQTTLIGVTVMGLYFLWRKWDFASTVLTCAALFTLCYAVLLKSAFAIWPQFSLAWDMQIQPAFTIFGLPAFEICWAFGYGLVFPLYLLLVFDARVEQVAETSRRVSPFPGFREPRS